MIVRIPTSSRLLAAALIPLLLAAACAQPQTQERRPPCPTTAAQRSEEGGRTWPPGPRSAGRRGGPGAGGGALLPVEVPRPLCRPGRRGRPAVAGRLRASAWRIQCGGAPAVPRPSCQLRGGPLLRAGADGGGPAHRCRHGLLAWAWCQDPRRRTGRRRQQRPGDDVGPGGRHAGCCRSTTVWRSPFNQGAR
jgi:hypothetical protein